MRPTIISLTLLMALGLAACATPEGTYPLTGKDCAEEDPVQDFGATDCTPVAGTGVGGL